MKLYFATGNPGKLEEAKKKLAPIGYEVEQSIVPYPEIQTDTLEEVVRYGLEWIDKKVGRPALIDDSGLFIEALGGFPGVYSAYIYKTIGNPGVLKLLADEDNRKARFETCIGFLPEKGDPVIVKGLCKGRIIEKGIGSDGFGYDPIFVPDGTEKTFAQMETDEKNDLSHRGKAFEALLVHLTGQ